MSCNSITSAPAKALNYIQTTRPYQALSRAGSYCKEAVQKVYDAVLPINPVTKHRELRLIPASVESFLGSIHYNSLCPTYKISQNVELNRRVTAVFEKLVNQCDRKGFKYEVRVMNDDKVVNAFCLPGGKIAITIGLINKLQEDLKTQNDQELLKDLTLDDKLAAVLGHEIGHACAGHSARSLQLKLLLNLVVRVASTCVGIFIRKKGEEQIQAHEPAHQKAAKKRKIESQANFASSIVKLFGSLSSYLVTQQYGQCHELESDRYSMQLAHRAGYKIQGAVWLQHKFLELHGEKEGQKKGFFGKAVSFFSSHPPSEERLNANRQTAKEILAETLR